MSDKSGWYTFFVTLVVAVVSVYSATSTALLQNADEGGAGSFSASHAYQYLQEIARAPHSMGTAEHERVGSYIVSTCNQLGLATTVQQTVAHVSRGHHLIAGNVQNIIARLKGRHSGKAVLIAAHYDSQPNAPGAGDDGAGVAAMLETARLLRSGPPPANDVIFLFTDGEEDGLLGAHAFVAESPLLKEVGIVLNFEGRGNCGISMMFETNTGNGWVINQFARAAAHPFANSLNYEVYRSLPNNTDYSIFKAAGVPGLNNAYIFL